jgi:hypothetical protein
MRLGTKNGCAGEGQQEFTGLDWPELVEIIWETKREFLEFLLFQYL